VSCSCARLLLRSTLGVALIVGLALGLVMLPGCGGKRSTPEKAAEAYLKAVKKQDLDGMLDCCAPDVREMLDEMIKVTGKKKTIEQQAGGGKLGKFKILGSEIKGDWANVEVSLTVNGKKQTGKFMFHKIENEWLFDMPDEAKEGMKMGVEMMKDPEKTKKIMDLLKRRTPKGVR